MKAKATAAKAPAWEGLATESRNPRSRSLDRMPISRVVALLLDEDKRALAAAQRQRRAITRAAVEAARALGAGRRIFFVGAGTSGRLGILEAAECPPTFGSDPDQVRGVMAGGEGAVFKAVEGAEDREDDGRHEGGRAAEGDLVIGISASSVTPFVRGALAAAREKGARTVLVTCAPRRGLKALAHVVIAIPTGPEVLTGSTRLKAGSATKAALNAITTSAMVGLGKAYENLMVDLKPTNAKLKDRARRIVVTAGKVTNEEADRLLEAAGGHVKTAIVMARTRDSADGARARIAAAGGHVRAAVARGRKRRRR
jgi:N-acetylmuramic acid 6-phosphate etherase